MKITLPDLLKLTQNPDYRRLPRDLAMSQIQEKDSWSSIVDHFTEEGAKEFLWKTGQLVAILFDTYERGISSFKITINTFDDASLDIETKINGQRCFSNTVTVNARVDPNWEAMGDMEVMKKVLTEFEGMGNARLSSQISEIRYHLSDDFTSSEQARQLAQEAAPEINSWVKRRLLDRQAELNAGARKMSMDDVTLWHVTERRYLDSILKNGLRALSYWASSEEVMEYYCECVEDEGQEPVIIQARLSDLLPFFPEPDYAGLEEPISLAIGMKEEEVWKRWEQTSMEWRDCLDLIGSVRIKDPIPTSSFGMRGDPEPPMPRSRMKF